MSRRHGSVTFALAAVLVATAGWTPAARQTFRSGVDAVQIDVLVTDGNRPLAGLSTDDFELRDNGVVQQIDAVALDDVPVTLMLVLDVSESVKGEPLQHLRAAIGAAGEALSPSDRLSLLTFSHHLDMAVSPTNDPESVRSAAQDVDAEGATALYDATLAALVTRHSIDGRAVLLIFSDGSDTSSWLDPRAVITAAQRSDVVVYGVTLRRQTEQRNVREARQNRLERGWFQEAPAAFGRHFLPLLTEETGGSVLVAERSDQLRDTFLRVIRDFKSRYILSYTPRDVEDGGWHAITVRLKGGRRGEVTARRGYLRGPS